MGSGASTKCEDVDSLTMLAKYCEQMEQYPHMRDYMKQVAQEKKVLTTPERNLFSVAYKNVTGNLRASWRVINSINSKNEKNNAAEAATISAGCKTAVEAQLTATCEDVISVLDGTLLVEENVSQSVNPGEAKVFYHKMKGDYFRYKAEYMQGADRDEALNSGKAAYGDALAASSELAGTNPIRLGLALNYSVFLYEIIKEPAKATEVAKNAFDEAVVKLDDLPEESYKDSTLIMQLLRDNLTLWTAESEKGE